MELLNLQICFYCEELVPYAHFLLNYSKQSCVLAKKFGFNVYGFARGFKNSSAIEVVLKQTNLDELHKAEYIKFLIMTLEDVSMSRYNFLINSIQPTV